MKTLYLHIGTPKTATSSIQKFLAQNREVLESKGYVFPKSLHRYLNVNSRRNGHFLVRKVEKAEGGRDHELEKQYLQEGYDLIAKEFQTYDHVILSDESVWFASSYSCKDLFTDLKKQADDNHYQVKIIVYLRRQDTFFLSRWNQAVKQNVGYSSVLSCDEYIRKTLKKDGKILNYAHKLDQIADIFGADNLIVRRFEPTSWVDGSIIHDFMEAIGIPVTESFMELEEDANLRLGKNETEIKRIVNTVPNLRREEVAYLGQALKTLSTDGTKEKPSEMLSVEELEEFLAPYEAGNTYVAETYLKDGKPLFSQQIKNVPKWDVDNPQMLPDVIAFFSSVSIDLYRRSAEQETEIRKLQKETERLRYENERLRNRFMQFMWKVKHPFRTLWNRVFKRK